MLDSLTYHMVDRSGDTRPPCPGRQAVLHHRRHRISGNGPGGTGPPEHPGQPGGPAHPSGTAGHRPPAGHQGDPEERLLRPPPGADRGPVRCRGGLPGIRRGRRRGHRRSRPRCRRPAPAVRVRHRHPLGRGGELRLPPRFRRRGQPARTLPGGGDHRGGAAVGRGGGTTGSGPLHPGVHGLRGRHPSGGGHGRSCSTAIRSAWRWTGAPRSPRPAASAATPTPSPGSPSASTGSPRRRGASWAEPASTSWPSGPSACGRTGSRSRWSRWARPGPSPWDGLTPIPTPRPWASGPWSASSAIRSP